MAQENTSLFGFSLDRRKDAAPKKAVSFVPKQTDDASTPIVAGGYFGQYVDIDGHVKNEWELIMRYRDMSVHPECDSAIDDIVNEAIAGELDDSPVEIELSNLPNVSSSLKKKLGRSFIMSCVCLTLIKRHMIFSVVGILTEEFSITK